MRQTRYSMNLITLIEIIFQRYLNQEYVEFIKKST